MSTEDPRADLRWGSVPALVAEVADRLGDAEALVDGDVRRTFAGLATEAAGVTGALMASGIGAGDRVALWAPNSGEWAVAALGALGAGAVLVPLNTRFKGGRPPTSCGPRGRACSSPCAASSASTTRTCSPARTWAIWPRPSC